MPHAQVAYRPHDHHRCQKAALAEAHALCRARGVRLTPLREKVLRLVWASHKPVGAYTLLEQLAPADRQGRAPSPPTVYRALDFLREQGLIHRIASLNAYTGCCRPDDTRHGAHFLVCTQCRRAQELPGEAALTPLRTLAATHGFTPSSVSLEIRGLCPDCHATTKAESSHDG